MAKVAQSKFKRPYVHYEQAGLKCTDKSLTQQQFKDETDVKNILKKHDRASLLQMVEDGSHFWGHDFTEANEYKDILNQVTNANEWFSKLPSRIRSHFENDPGYALEFISNPKNRDELVSLGLMEKPPEKPVDKPKATEGDNPTPKEPKATEKDATASEGGDASPHPPPKA